MTITTTTASGKEQMSPAARVVAGQLAAEATYRAVTHVLGSYGIEHLLLKGPHLGAIAYKDACDRAYSDLDILIRPIQFDDATSALVENGFVLIEGPKGRYNCSLLSPHGWVVELHHAFSAYDLFRVDIEALFGRAETFCFGQVAAMGLAHEDLLLHLVIHAAKGHFREIEPKHVKDVSLLVALHPFRWEMFLARSLEVRCQTASWVLLSAAVSIHGADVPCDVLNKLLPSLARRLWLGFWLNLERFPLFRWQRLPIWLGRLVVSPAIVDRLRDGVASGLRFAVVRARDVIGRLAG